MSSVIVMPTGTYMSVNEKTRFLSIDGYVNCHAYCIPSTLMFIEAPPGGAFWSVEANAAFAATGLPFSSMLDAAGFLIPGSITKVAIVRKTRITAAPTVQPISRRVLPWICAATRPFFARNLNRHQNSTPSTPTKTMIAMTRMIA